jgi:1-acyl-sn-glycerol-3-phosphate acyltransferase
VSASRRLRRALATLAVMLLSWACAAGGARRLGRRRRRRLATRLAGWTLAALGVSLDLRGRRVGGTEPLLVVANHVSWLDAYVLNALYEARFVAKSETGSWPVVGTIAHAFDSLFIVRGSFRDAARVKDRVAAALRAGERVVVFPEATTTDGTRLREFRAAMFQAAVDAGVRIQPVALRYLRPNGRVNTAAAFVDDDTFVASLLRVLRDRSLRVQVRFGPPLPAAAGTRRDLAAAAHAFVADALRIPAAAVRPQLRAASRAWPGLARATGS